MAVELNHTIVCCRDNAASAAFLAEISDCRAGALRPVRDVVETGNGVYAGLHRRRRRDHRRSTTRSWSAKAEFDEIFGRIQRARPDLLGRPGQTPARARSTTTTAAEACT